MGRCPGLGACRRIIEEWGVGGEPWGDLGRRMGEESREIVQSVGQV